MKGNIYNGIKITPNTKGKYDVRYVKLHTVNEREKRTQ